MVRSTRSGHRSSLSLSKHRNESRRHLSIRTENPPCPPCQEGSRNEPQGYLGLRLLSLAPSTRFNLRGLLDVQYRQFRMASSPGGPRYRSERTSLAWHRGKRGMRVRDPTGRTVPPDPRSSAKQYANPAWRLRSSVDALLHVKRPRNGCGDVSGSCGHRCSQCMGLSHCPTTSPYTPTRSCNTWNRGTAWHSATASLTESSSTARSWLLPRLIAGMLTFCAFSLPIQYQRLPIEQRRVSCLG